jgi:hypothetical protein
MNKVVLITLPIVLALIGLALWVAGTYSLVDSMRQTGIQLSAPGATTVTITNAGDYTIWNQTKGIVDGQFKTFSEKPPPGLVMKVTSQPDGAQIPLNSAMTSSVQNGGTRKVSVASLTFNAPGQYQVEISGLAEKRAFSLEHSKLRNALAFMLNLVTGFFFMIAALAAGVYALIRLLTNKKPQT